MNVSRTLLLLTLLISVCSAQEPKTVIETPSMPENPPKTWLTYHLAHPVPEFALDPNPAFFWKGRYHLHYIYRNLTGYVFAHVSSDDMVHWKWHPTVLGPTTTGHERTGGSRATSRLTRLFTAVAQRAPQPFSPAVHRPTLSSATSERHVR